MTEPATGINAKLLAFAKRAPVIELDATGQIQSREYRYATLDQVVAKVRPILNDLGLVLVQKIDALSYDDLHVSTRLVDVETAEEIAMRVPLPPPKDMQALGAAITYARRYSIVSLLVLVAEEDDDAARPGAAEPRAVGSAAPGGAPSPEATPAFTEDQLAELTQVMADLKARDGLINWDDKARMYARNKLNKAELAQLTQADMAALISHMREELANLG